METPVGEKRTHAVREARVELHVILVNLVVALNTEVLALGELEGVEVELLGVHHEQLVESLPSYSPKRVIRGLRGYFPIY